MRWREMSRRRHHRDRAVYDERLELFGRNAPVLAVRCGGCRGHGGRRVLSGAGECAAADSTTTDSGAASSGDHRDPRPGADAAGRDGASSRNASIQSASARARFLGSRFLALDSPSARDRFAACGNTVRHDFTVRGGLRRCACPLIDSAAVGHASCSSQAVARFRVVFAGDVPLLAPIRDRFSRAPDPQAPPEILR